MESRARTQSCGAQSLVLAASVSNLRLRRLTACRQCCLQGTGNPQSMVKNNWPRTVKTMSKPTSLQSLDGGVQHGVQ
eukprot:11156545-Lingulodinium_polyedra.AAC.1